jgi:flagellar protein FlaG
MIDAVKNINTDIRSNLGGFKTQLDADGYNQQKQVAEFIKKVNSKKEIDTEKQNTVDYKKFESEVKNFLKDNNLAIEFSIDDNTKKMVMKLIDEDTKEIVKQFPSEISLHIARILSSSLKAGNITNVKV